MRVIDLALSNDLSTQLKVRVSWIHKVQISKEQLLSWMFLAWYKICKHLSIGLQTPCKICNVCLITSNQAKFTNIRPTTPTSNLSVCQNLNFRRTNRIYLLNSLNKSFKISPKFVRKLSYTIRNNSGMIFY